MAHNLINWCIDEDKFSYTDLSASSKKFKKGIEDWLNSYNDQEREEFVHDLFSLFKRADIKSLLDIKKNKIKKLNEKVYIFKKSRYNKKCNETDCINRLHNLTI